MTAMVEMGLALMDPRWVLHLEGMGPIGDEVVVLSAGPAAGIVARFEVDLPRPRPLLDIRTDPRFHALYAKVWSALRAEVMRSHERQL